MRFRQQVREGARSASSYPAPKLMELRQTEPFGPANHYGVRSGNIEAALHDIGRKENVRLAFDEAHHSVVDLIGGQLAVKTDDAQIRSRRLDPRQHRVQVLNARTNQEALSATPLLAQQRRGDGSVR